MCSPPADRSAFLVVHPSGSAIEWHLVVGRDDDLSLTEKEPHLLHTFEDDFYGEKLYLLLCGFIRNELNFKSLGEEEKETEFLRYDTG